MFFRLTSALKGIAGIYFAVGLVACTDLKVTHLAPGAPSENLTGEIPYVLPKKTLVMSVTYVLKRCQTTASTLLDMEVSAKAVLVGLNEADESERYSIPYVALSSWLKETNFTLENHGNKTLKSFSASINDQSASVITATIGTVIKTAALVAGAARADTGPADKYCDQEAMTALQTIANKKQCIEQLRTQPKPVKPENAKDGASGSGPDLCNEQLPTQPNLVHPEDAKDDVSGSGLTPAEEYKIAVLQADIDRIVSQDLTTKVALTWSPTASELKNWYPGRDYALRPLHPDVAVSRWLTPAGRDWLLMNRDPKNTINVVASVPTWAHPAKVTGTTAPPVEGQIDGFVVRDPALGSILVCKGECPIPQNGVVSVDNIVASSDAAFPQLGRRLVLPLHNSIGQNSVLDVSMSEDGVITRLGPRSTSTAAAGITALGTNMDAEKARVDARDKAKNDALTAAQNKPHDDNARLAECLAAQKVILENGGTPIGVCQ